MSISNFLWQRGMHEVRWKSRDIEVVKSYSIPVRSAICLRDGTGVAIVEPHEEVGSRNAVIYNEDGSERFRLEHPEIDPYREILLFAQMYYVDDELTAFALTASADYGVVIDPETGETIRTYYTR